MKKINYRLINLLILLVVIYILFLLKDLFNGIFIKLISILKPFIISFLMAYALYPVLKFFQEKKIPKSISILIIIIIIIIFLGFIIYSLIPIFSKQLITLFSSIITFIKDFGTKFDIDISLIEDSLNNIFDRISNTFGKYISKSAVNVLNTSVNFISNIIIISVTFIYYLFDMDKIRESIRQFLKIKSKKIYKLIDNIDYQTTQYFKGLFITLVIQFFEYTIIFYLIGHPNFLLLGVLSSISSLIPYFGGFLVNFVSIVTASVVSQKLLILTLVVAVIFPIIDGYIVSPKIYGKTNNISPLLTIFAVFSGGVLGGIIGIIISLPILIIIRTIYNYYKDDLYKKIINIKKYI